MNNNGNYEWTGEVIKDDGEFFLIDNADCEFIIDKVNCVVCSSKKVPAGCYQAELEMRILYEDHEVKYTERLILNHMFDWKLSAFWRSVGMKKRGQECPMDWDHAKGLSGWAHFEAEEYISNNGETKKANRLKRYIDPEEKQAPTGAAEDLPF